MPTSPHKRTLYIVLADHFILHTPVISTPPLPATLCLLYLYTHTYIYIYISLSLSPHLPYPLPRAWTPTAVSAHWFATRRRQARLTSWKSPPTPPRNGAKKGTPPQTYVFYFPILPPVGVAAMSTSPRDITLCPMLPHRFLLHAKSLPGPTLKTPPKPEVHRNRS